MNLLAEYNRRQQEEKAERIRKTQQQRIQKANTIRRVLEDPAVIEGVKEFLMERGVAGVTGFGCCCVSGCCSKLDGYQYLLSDLVEYWKSLGVHLEITKVRGPSFHLIDKNGKIMDTVVKDYNYRSFEEYRTIGSRKLKSK